MNEEVVVNEVPGQQDQNVLQAQAPAPNVPNQGGEVPPPAPAPQPPPQPVPPAVDNPQADNLALVAAAGEQIGIDVIGMGDNAIVNLEEIPQPPYMGPGGDASPNLGGPAGDG